MLRSCSSLRTKDSGDVTVKNTRWLRALITRYGSVGYLMVGGVVLGVAFWQRRRWTLPLIGLLLILLLSTVFWHGRETPPLTVAFLDVGKGDAIVMETPSTARWSSIPAGWNGRNV